MFCFSILQSSLKLVQSKIPLDWTLQVSCTNKVTSCLSFLFWHLHIKVALTSYLSIKAQTYKQANVNIQKYTSPYVFVHLGIETNLWHWLELINSDSGATQSRVELSDKRNVFYSAHPPHSPHHKIFYFSTLIPRHIIFDIQHYLT